MDYEEIITAYESGGLDVSSLKKKLEMSESLQSYHDFGTIEKCIFYFNIVNFMTTSEKPEKVENFEISLNYILEEYYESLIKTIKKLNAWEFMGITETEFSIDQFKNLQIQEKFTRTYELSEKYSEYLEYQKIANLRDEFKPNNDFIEYELEHMTFLQEMYNSFNTEAVKDLFYTFKKDFLELLITFRKSKIKRLDEYMESKVATRNKKRKEATDSQEKEETSKTEKVKSRKTKNEALFEEYTNCLRFLSVEDFRDIAENITLASEVLGENEHKICTYYSVMSEVDAERNTIQSLIEDFKELEKKYLVMRSLKDSTELENTENVDKKQEEANKALEEENRKREEELEKIRQEAEAKEKAEKEKAESQKIVDELQSFKELGKTSVDPKDKELVKPLLFYWFGKEDTSLARKIGTKKLNEFFDVLKKYESENGVRISLFMITNANQETSKKRVEELQKKAKEKGMPKLIEGALGGYSSFKVTGTGNIIDISRMSLENRQKIKMLLDRRLGVALLPEIIDETEENYLRYEFSSKPDPSITMEYLKMMIYRLKQIESIGKQPIKFIPYMEKGKTGIDVLLESQYEGLKQLPDYYNTKYNLVHGKGLQADANAIDEFLEKYQDVEGR